MAGQIKKLIDLIIEKKAQNNQALINLTKTKLMLKGINPDKYTIFSEDDPLVLAKMEDFAEELGIDICSIKEEKVDILTAFSKKPTVNEAVQEIYSKFENFNLKLLVFFASSSYNPEKLSREMQKNFKYVQTFGCTTAGEIVTGKLLKNSIVAMGFSSCIIEDFKIEVAKNILQNSDVSEIFSSFEDYFNTPMLKMDNSKYLGIILVDGLSKTEEKIMEKIGDLTNVYFVGGAAGDYLDFSSTYVFVNGNAYSDAAVLVLLKPTVGFNILKTQSFLPTDKKLIATKVNQHNRAVLEFNDKPAVQAYAEALSVGIDELPEFFMSNPVGIMIDGEPFIRSPQRIEGDSIVFYCNVYPNTELTVMKPSDIISETRGVIEKGKEKLGDIAGLINFNCILRTQELEKEQKLGEYASLFKDFPTVGFSTYGEEYIGHLNQTSTMVLLKND